MLPANTRKKMSESKRRRDIARIATAAGCSPAECEERLSAGQRYCAKHQTWRTAPVVGQRARCWRCDEESYKARRAKKSRAA